MAIEAIDIDISTSALPATLLLDSRVVELTQARHPIFAILSFSKPLFFKDLKVELRALGQIAAQDPGIQPEPFEQPVSLPAPV